MLDFKSFDEVKDFFASKGFNVTDDEVMVCSDHSMKIVAEDKIEQISISKRLSEFKRYSDNVNYLFLYQKDFSVLAFLRRIEEPRKFVYDKNRNYPEETKNSIRKKINGIKYEDGIFNSTIENLFDVKPIIKEFYNRYQEVRDKLSNEINIGDKSTTYAQIILDRIIFIYFLQAKKILKDEKYLSNLFINHDKSRNFFEDYLKPLFFECFNSEPKNKNDMRKINGIEFGIIPYLNGGLFNQKIIEEENPKVKIRDKIWEDIFDVFNKYEWIVGEEADSNSLTPSILGHIFEKSIHEEERKGTGSYYTPKEITRYIAENTIYPCIVDKVNNFLKEKKSSKEIKNIEGVFELDKSILKNIKMNNVLIKISICDNACGSGAFLLAAAQLLWDIYNRINEKIGDNKHENLDLWLKKEIIKNNIYGVDINPDAIEIAKLRLWLWLVESYSISKIEALPNIDYKIRCGNSLIGFLDLEKIKDSLKSNLFGFVANKNISVLDEIIKLKEKYINTIAEKEERKELDKKMSPLRDKLDKLFFDKLKKDGIIKDFDEFKEKMMPFHYGLEFYEIFDLKKPKEERGFDIIIGNPPYVKEYVNKNAFDGLRNSPYYKGKMDLWYFFTCKSIDLLRKEGVLAFIAQNNWVTSYGASIMRNKIIQETKILNLIDFGDYKIFDTAGIQTMIIIFKKENEIDNYFFDFRKLNYVKGVDFQEVLNILSRRNSIHVEYLLPKIKRTEFINMIIAFSNLQFNNILEKIKQKGDYYLTDENVAQGIVCPQEFIINTHIKKLGDSVKKGDGIFTLNVNEINNLNLLHKEREIVKPFYTTDELFKYYGNPKNHLWVIYSDTKVRKNIKEYPHIKEHLDKFKKIITSDFGPYGLHRARKQKFFEGEKILSLRKTSKPKFTYTDFSCYVSQTYFVIKPSDIDLKFLTTLLNSKLTEFWLKHNGKMQGNIFQIDKEPLLNIPIKTTTKEQQKPFIQLVDQILSTTKDKNYIDNPDKQAKVKKLEKEIDQLVYKLYELTPEEIKIVEEFNNG